MVKNILILCMFTSLDAGNLPLLVTKARIVVKPQAHHLRKHYKTPLKKQVKQSKKSNMPIKKENFIYIRKNV